MKYVYNGTSYTFKDYKNFCYTITLKRKINIILFILDILFLTVSIWLKDIALIVGSALYIPLFYILYNINIKRTYKSNKLMQNDSVLTIEFYDTYCIQKTAISETRLDYDMIYKIIDTKTYVYILIGKNQGAILKKECFPEGLEKFLIELKNKKISRNS